MYDILELSKKLLPELKDIAKELKIKKPESLKKQDLIYKILDQQAIESIKPKYGIKPENEVIQPDKGEFSKKKVFPMKKKVFPLKKMKFSILKMR